MKSVIKRSVLLLMLLCVLTTACTKKDVVENVPEEKKEEVPVEKKISIIDTESNLRPIAVMINNHKDARPQVGLKSAFIVYELMVEGGITRMMALYEPTFTEEKIGSIRSARHNYLDYAMESDAIFVHWGDSIYAKEDMKTLKIDHIDGMVYGTKYFTTDKNLKRSLEHTRFTSSSMLNEAIDKLIKRKTTDKGHLLNYTTDTVDLSKIEGATLANNVSIKYSNYQTSSYEYDSENQVYKHYMAGNAHTDLNTGEQYTFKNIIAYAVTYKRISDHDHQDLQNVGSGEGVYITNGYSIPIKWEKKTRDGKTKYMYEDGTELKVSDGNTFIQIYPKTGSLTIN